MKFGEIISLKLYNLMVILITSLSKLLVINPLSPLSLPRSMGLYRNFLESKFMHNNLLKEISKLWYILEAALISNSKLSPILIAE